MRCLENEGTLRLGLPGEEILEVLDALSRSTAIRFVLTRHEQGAAFMADVYGRLSTFPGVLLATLGPGATNLITGIADANLDRAPLVAITGQAGLERVYKESHQYIDVVQMLRPITRWNARIEQPGAVPEMVRKAFRLARLEKPRRHAPRIARGRGGHAGARRCGAHARAPHHLPAARGATWSRPPICWAAPSARSSCW